MKIRNYLVSLVVASIGLMGVSCSSAGLLAPTATAQPDAVFLGAGFVEEPEGGNLMTSCFGIPCKVYSSTNGIDARYFSNNTLLMIFYSDSRYNDATQKATLSSVISKLFGSGVNTWLVNHYSDALSSKQEGNVGGFDISLQSVDAFSTVMTSIAIMPEGSNTIAPFTSNIEVLSSTTTVPITPSLEPTISIKDKLFEIRNWVIIPIWNDYIDNLATYASSGTDAVGNGNFDAAFAARKLGMEITTAMVEYDKYISSLDPSFATLKEDWALVTEQMVIIYNQVKGKTTEQIAEMDGIDTSLFVQYREAFTKDVDEYYDS